ncbi:MAG: cell wall-binding repeat-containing protein [Tissierellia bacterium]|nr:cell wall-binding repeat-containing protein [Tissierellia bacterium]
MKQRFLGLLLALCLLLPAGLASADNVSVQRISGEDRYQTAIQISKNSYAKSNYAIIASGENYADALVGGTLSVQIKAPLYLTKKDSLPEGLKEELERIHPEEIYLIGGVEAISSDLEDELSKDFTIKRVSGKDRQKTAEKVVELRYLINKGSEDAFKKDEQLTNFLVNGYKFPDSISAAPLVGRMVGKEIFAALCLEENNDKYPDAYIIGGEESVKGESDKRISGPNRFITSLEVAKEYEKNFDGFSTVIIVNGEDYPDALSASALSAMENAPILLSKKDSIDESVLSYIKSKAKKVMIVGGEMSVSQLVEKDIFYDSESNYFYAEELIKSKGISRDNLNLTGNEREDILGLFLDEMGMLELSETFSEEKSENIIGKDNLPKEMTTAESKRIAAIISTTSLEIEDILGIYEDGDDKVKSSIDIIATAINGEKTEEAEFILNSNDENVYSKLENAFNSSKLFLDNATFKAGVKAVSEGLTTGFNIKSISKNDFDPENTIIYGHSDISHAKQLIALLKSEGIEVNIELEPKTSAFVYLLEWGPIPEPTDSYEVVKISDDLYIANALEYDLLLEFVNGEDKDKFDDLINKYAKKNSDNPEGKNLLVSSWWQPLYTSRTEMQKGYGKLIDNSAKLDDYEFHTFSFKEDSDKLIKGLEKIDPDLEINTIDIWADDAFIRYLNGESE